MSTASVSVATALVVIGLYAYMSSGSTQGKPPFGSFGFRTLRLQSSEQVSHDTKRLRFELPEKDVPCGLPLTSALLTISKPEGRWLPVPRPYTPVNDLSEDAPSVSHIFIVLTSSPDEKGYVDLLVKLYPDGKASTHLHSLKVGDTLTCTRIPGYGYKVNAHPHVAMIAGGAGITPMYQLLRGILSSPDDHTRVTLVWGINGERDIFLRDELAALQEKHSKQLRIVYVVSKPEKESSEFQTGRVTAELLRKEGLAATEEGNANTKVLVCGPPAMEKSLKGGVLAELGYTAGQIYSF